MLLSCGWTTGSDAEPRPSNPATAESICENRSELRDRSVSVEGTFLGWRGTSCPPAACASGATTRGDWRIRVGTECFYVMGGRPATLDPLDSASTGRRLRLTAIVRMTGEEQVYLQHVASTALD